MRIMLVTDAWDPQVNGVVRTMKRVITECEALGHTWDIVSPNGFKTIPLPTYSEIKLAFGAKKVIEERFLEFKPDAVHIATEGPLGWAARAVCLRHKFPYTTAYHTRFPEYISARFFFLPTWMGYMYVREFHKYSGRVMVATASMRDELAAQRFKNIIPWSRGVDTDLFHPSKRKDDRGPFKGMKQPIWLNVGRVAVEKNISAFLDTLLEGTKVVVGDGPQLEALREKHKDVHFLGVKQGEELAACFANADCFVFPSLTDTFGLVILEAMAAGTPVAGFNVPGPSDLIPGTGAGAVNDDLATACREALACSREVSRTYAETYSWRACAEQFINNLEPLPVPERRRFWKRLARLRHALRLRRRKPKPGEKIETKPGARPKSPARAE
ncbi:MAG: alpha-mannosyltransferase [Alphaproteobacteria bacterium 32-64-14]|nr:MAG: alpha-mannosyltransferase [Alphaproteobacteria bacterium 32-64-14]